MRKTFHDELDDINSSLVELTDAVGTAIDRATQALLTGDLQVAESVISRDRFIDQLAASVEARTIDLVARQQPVASDLRLVMTSMRMVADLERMGDLADHIAKVARMRYPERAIPAELADTIADMGRAAQRIVTKCGTVIARRDVVMAAQLERDDDVMDQLHRRLFRALLDPTWGGGIECAIDVTLCGRYYERFADHAVSVARRVVYLVTGEHPQVIPTRA